MIDLPHDEALGTAHEPKTSVFDHATRLASLLALVLAIILQLTQKPAPILWTFLILIVVLVLLGFYPRLKSATQRLIERVRIRRVMRSALPKFRSFVRRFGEFVDSARADTLQSLVQNDLYQGRTDQFIALGIPDVQLWRAFWAHLSRRSDARELGQADFVDAISEFHTLVALYNNFCVTRIFNRFPQQMQQALTPYVKSNLNAFQQRFGFFLSSYEEFAKDLASSWPALQQICYPFERPKPL